VRHLAEHEPRIKFHAVFFQQGNEFRLEIHPAMMLFLRLDVPDDRRNTGSTHAKRRVPLLPGKFVALFIRPPRRIRFDREHRFRQRQLLRDLDEKMNVIVCATDGVDEMPWFLQMPPM